MLEDILFEVSIYDILSQKVNRDQKAIYLEQR
jgi:hypothetical protein